MTASFKKHYADFKKVVLHSDNSCIVHDKHYVYFSLNPSFEEISFESFFKTADLQGLLVKNFKNQVIGYLLFFIKKTNSLRVSDNGASIYFSKYKTNFSNYTESNVVFADSKFRLLSFDGKDFFASVKWKANGTVRDKGERDELAL